MKWYYKLPTPLSSILIIFIRNCISIFPNLWILPGHSITPRSFLWCISLLEVSRCILFILVNSWVSVLVAFITFYHYFTVYWGIRWALYTRGTKTYGMNNCVINIKQLCNLNRSHTVRSLQITVDGSFLCLQKNQLAHKNVKKNISIEHSLIFCTFLLLITQM